ncbi:MAG: hypothetical protein PUC65_07940 [Clostridiales bacterium]|nr:hypothetical protein [Clostridiales bacterium]
MYKITLMKANLKHRKGTFIGIALFMLIITLSLTVVTSVLDNFNAQLNEAQQEAHTGDVVTFISDKYANGAMQEAILSHENVGEMIDVQSIAIRKGKIKDTPLFAYLHVVDAQKHANKYRLYDDSQDRLIEAKDPIKPGEIYLPICCKGMYHCNIGDIFTYETKKGERQFVIKGFVEEPFIGAYVINVKQAFISSEDFETLSSISDDIEQDPAPYLLPFHMLHIFQKQPGSMDITALKKALNDECRLIDFSYATLSREESCEYTLMLPTTFGDILYIFVGLLFVIVLIVMSHSISTGIEMDYVNFGVLKSQGFSKGELRHLLVLQYFIAQVIGTLLGMLLSLPMIHVLGRVLQDITGLLARNTICFGKSLLYTCILLAMGAVFVYIKTAKIGSISPVKAISGGREQIYFDSFGTIKIQKRWMILRLSLRQFTSAKKQYIGIILIVSILTYFLMAMTLLTAGVEVHKVYELFGGVTSDIEVSYSDYYTHDQKEEIVKKINEISKVTYSLDVVHRYVIVDGNEYNTQIYDDPKEFKSIRKGREPIYDNEILVTEFISKTLNVTVGDTLTIACLDRQEEYIVSGIYVTIVDVGKCIGISLDGVRRIADFQPVTGYYNIKDPDKIDEVVAMLNDQFSDLVKSEVSDNTEELSDLITITLNIVTIFIYVISIIFTFIIVSMVCKKTFLKERQDIGIFKAIGFTVIRLRLAFSLRFLFVSLLGCGVGVLLSVAFNEKMMSYLLSSCGLGNFKADLTPVTIIAPTVLVNACFFVFSYFASHRIKKVAVRELVTE